ncbi:TPA: hypothetical protein N2F43_003201 [Salmonella enterica]|nr:hypothetical protein [Salmonella enterica]
MYKYEKNKSNSFVRLAVPDTNGVAQGLVDNRVKPITQLKRQSEENNTTPTKKLYSNTSMVKQLNRDEDKKPFVKLAPGVKEKDTRLKTGLLGEALATDETVRTKKSEKNRPPSKEAKYLYHSTTYKNLITIISNGLDPNRGGSEVGASVLAEGELKDESIKGSQNHVHGATRSEVALHYANKFDAKENKNETREGAGFAVVLRFLVGDKNNWTEDTEDHRGNYKTEELIPPKNIEFLDVESGWQPLSSIDINILKALETEKSLVPVSAVRDETPESPQRTGVIEERNLSSIIMSPDGKY